ncbi:MAG: tetratricopeptide repeat protein [Pseudomonadota bacterium]
MMLRYLISITLCATLSITAHAAKDSVSTSTYKELTEIQELMATGAMDESATRLITLLGEVEDDSLDQALTLQTIGYVEMSREDFPKAIDYLKRSLATERLPQNVVYNVGYMVAQLHAALGQFDEALVFAEDWFTQLETPTASQYMFMANIYAQVKRYAESVPYAEQAVSIAEKPRESWYQLLTANYFELKRYPEAADALLRMIALWPEKGGYWEQLASVYMVMDQPERALASLKIAFDQSLLDKASTVKSMIQLAVLQGIPEHGARLLSRAVEEGLVPEEEDILEMQAQAWVTAREYDLGIEAYQRKAELFGSAEPWMKIANLHVDRARWQRAEIAAVRALESELKEPGKAWLILGIARVEQGKFETGRKALRKAAASKGTERSAASWMRYADDMKRQADWLAANK